MQLRNSDQSTPSVGRSVAHWPAKPLRSLMPAIMDVRGITAWRSDYPVPVYPERTAQPPPPDPAFWLPGEPGWGRHEGNRAASVCRRGHAKETALTQAPDRGLGFCTECGAEILSRCPSCGIRILGTPWWPGVAVFEEYVPPRFCDGCGEPFPWATRQQRIYQLENLLDEEDIDEPTRLLVLEDLERLRASDDLDEQQQFAVWQRIRTRAPGLFAGTAWKISQTLLTAYLKDKLGLR